MEKIKTLGKVILNFKIGNVEKKVEFEVFDGKSMPILGLKSSIDFNLIKRIKLEKEDEYVNMLNASTVNKEHESFLKRNREVFARVTVNAQLVSTILPCRRRSSLAHALPLRLSSCPPTLLP